MKKEIKKIKEVKGIKEKDVKENKETKDNKEANAKETSTMQKTEVLRIEDNSRFTVLNIDENSEKTIIVINKTSRNLKIKCGKNSKVKYIEINNSDNEYEINRELFVSKNATLDFYNLCAGTKNQKSDTLAELDEKSELNLKNIFISNSQEHSHGLKVIHKQRESKSTLESRGVLSDSKMSIKGLIKIEETAGESQGYQKSDMLILKDSEVLSVPDLEIKNNNVKCSHGSSISRLDAEKIFYLQTRGLDEAKAKEVIINAFFSSMIEKLEDAEKEKLGEIINGRLALIADKS